MSYRDRYKVELEFKIQKLEEKLRLYQFSTPKFSTAYEEPPRVLIGKDVEF